MFKTRRYENGEAVAQSGPGAVIRAVDNRCVFKIYLFIKASMFVIFHNWVMKTNPNVLVSWQVGWILKVSNDKTMMHDKC